MAVQRTFSIIKPDATKRNLTGKVVAKFEEAGLRVVASKRIHLSPAQAGQFYAEHKERPFYGELCSFMASEPVVVQVLEGEGAIAKNREVMGATDPAKAAPGTIRAEFGKDISEKAAKGDAIFVVAGASKKVALSPVGGRLEGALGFETKPGDDLDAVLRLVVAGKTHTGKAEIHAK